MTPNGDKVAIITYILAMARRHHHREIQQRLMECRTRLAHHEVPGRVDDGPRSQQACP